MVARLAGEIHENVTTYIEQGYACVPIPSGKKGPIIPGWQSLRLKSADAFSADSNVGVILGTASGGLVCVDLDHPTAVELAEQFLPPTDMIGGHGERTHCFYRVDGQMKKRTYSATNKTLLIEVLAEGQQVVVGPSVHPDGSIYTVLTGEPTAITQEALLESVERLSSACKAQLGGGNLQGVMTSNLQSTSTLNDLSATLHRIGATVLSDGQTATGAAGFCVVCPGEHLHTQRNGPKDCLVWIGSAGGFQANCVHSSCGVHSWQAFRSACDPSWTQRVQWSPTAPPEQSTAYSLTVRSVADLVREFPQQREPVVHGLLRRGEVMNVIAAPKVGKSWMTAGLAFAVASGTKWLDFETTRGRVLVIDNELHPNTSAQRYPLISQSMMLSEEDYGDRLHIVNLRGAMLDLPHLATQLTKLGGYDLIILDAWYRFQPPGSDENSNSDTTALYNLLDSMALEMDAAFVAVHHTSKGNQFGKSVTDVGSGAGAQSRAADSHMIIRQHEEPGIFVIDGAVRSWAPVKAFCVRWSFPIWHLAKDLDPSLLKIEYAVRRKATKPPDDHEVVAAEKDDREFMRLNAVLGAYRMFPDGETSSVVAAAAGLSNRNFGPIQLRLRKEKMLIATKVTKNRQTYDGYKLVQTDAENDSLGHSDNDPFFVRVSECPSEGGIGTRTSAPPLGGAVCPSDIPPLGAANSEGDESLSDCPTVRAKRQKAKSKTTPKAAKKKVAKNRCKGSPITNAQHPITTNATAVAHTPRKAKTKKALTSSEKIKDLRAMVTKAGSLLDRMTDTMANAQKPDSPPTDITAKPGSGALFDSFYNGY